MSISRGCQPSSFKNEIEEGDLVAVEGEVQCKIKGGGILDAVFFDLYRMENGKIKELKSFVVEKVRTDSMSVFRP